jgi:membrane protease YdiL (CAAX protease family)
MTLRSLGLFFLLAFAYTWIFHGSMAVFGLRYESGLGLSLYRIGLVGPLVAALVVSTLKGGVNGLRKLAVRILNWRVSFKWYLLSLLWVGLLRLGGLGIHTLRTGQTPERYIDIPEIGLLALFLSQLFVLVAEEVGWRGFALPDLIRYFGSFGAALLLGALWALWHIPMFFVPDLSQYGTPFILYTLTQIAWSVVMTFLFLRSGSVLVAMLFHIGINVWFYLIPIPNAALPEMAILLTVTTAALIPMLPRPLFRWNVGVDDNPQN